MLITLNFNSDIPIYLQLRNKIVIGIGTGELKQNESLPTVRQLAEDIGVNAMTVNKAYTMLKNEGFISIDRRHGAKVNVTREDNHDIENMLENELTLVISEAGLKGVSKSDFLSICSDIFEKMGGLKFT